MPHAYWLSYLKYIYIYHCYKISCWKSSLSCSPERSAPVKPCQGLTVRTCDLPRTLNISCCKAHPHSDLANMHLSAISEFSGKHPRFSSVLSSFITAAHQRYLAESEGYALASPQAPNLSPRLPKVITHMAAAHLRQRLDWCHAPEKQRQALVAAALSHAKLCIER